MTLEEMSNEQLMELLKQLQQDEEKVKKELRKRIQT